MEQLAQMFESISVGAGAIMTGIAAIILAGRRSGGRNR